MGQIYLVRHGQASFGTANYDRLSEIGVAQSRQLGRWYAQRRQGFNRVITGGMKRHHETALACLSELPVAVHLEDSWESDAGFAEYDHEEILARLRPEFADPVVLARYLEQTDSPRQVFQHLFAEAMRRWMRGEADADYRESWSAFRSRCIAALERVIRAPGSGQEIIVFTSGGTISTICQHVLGLSDAKMFELNWTMANTGVTRLLFDSDRVSLSYLNNFAHLEWPGQQGTITYR